MQNKNKNKKEQEDEEANVSKRKQRNKHKMNNVYYFSLDGKSRKRKVISGMNEQDSRMNQCKKYQKRRIITKPWGVRICSNKKCRTTWNRDRNSSHNMMVLTWYIICFGKDYIPGRFIRGTIL